MHFQSSFARLPNYCFVSGSSSSVGFLDVEVNLFEEFWWKNTNFKRTLMNIFLMMSLDADFAQASHSFCWHLFPLKFIYVKLLANRPIAIAAGAKKREASLIKWRRLYFLMRRVFSRNRDLNGAAPIAQTDQVQLHSHTEMHFEVISAYNYAAASLVFFPFLSLTQIAFSTSETSTSANNPTLKLILAIGLLLFPIQCELTMQLKAEATNNSLVWRRKNKW